MLRHGRCHKFTRYTYSNLLLLGGKISEWHSHKLVICEVLCHNNLIMLALTGTATPVVVKAVKYKLSIDDMVIVGIPSTTSRDNIKYYVCCVNYSASSF